mmetsp:Transcript_52650/g.113788  ORF Transcript_52650/g.113788 Transcript_52650/m.113788 type:complete len:204 (+) Transcript_52650:66-677(+)
MSGPPVINAKYIPSTSRQTFIYYDASFRGGKIGQDSVMKFYPSPKDLPAKRWMPVSLRPRPPKIRIGEAAWDEAKDKASSSVATTVRSLKENINSARSSSSGFSRTGASCMASTPRHPILAWRVDPALDEGLSFERRAGLSARGPPPLPRSSQADPVEPTSCELPQAPTSRQELMDCDRRLPVDVRNGFTRTPGGGYWFVNQP